MTSTSDAKKDGSKTEAPSKATESKSGANAPLAPPPKPGQNTSDSDYFSAAHGGSHFSLEPNPFEQSFGNTSTAETPGKFGGLPSVASLTSPQPLGPTGTPGWGGSLRSGPLSPAMLAGPTGNTGYFDDSFRGSFPTPNESSLRSGLTPGGGGSIFPAPSPNSQALFNSLQSGGATPGTLDFQRTAMNAAARSKVEGNTSQSNNSSSNGAASNSNSNTSNNANGAGATNNNTSATSNTNSKSNQNMAGNNQNINKADYQPAQSQQNRGQDPFANHSESDAVNSLYLLAQTGNRNANQFAVPNHPNVAQMNRGDNGNQQEQSNASSAPNSGNKKGSAAKNGQNANNRRKAEETPVKGNNKRAKGNNGMSQSPDMDDDDDDDMSESDIKNEEGSGGRKMTDEEKRKNFLERNRIAALKCRQRKKQWLANLQTKVEIFQSENDALTAQCTTLREEIVNLKSLLLAHKDCPVSHSQGLGGNAMAQVIGDFNPHANPYGIPLGSGGQMMGMQNQGMQRG